MTTRDRIALMAISALVLLGVVWLLVVSPERDKAAKLAAQVSTAKAQLAATESQATNAQAALSEALARSSRIAVSKLAVSSSSP